MTKVTVFDRATCRMVSDRVTVALKELGDELGITFKQGSGRYAPESFTMKLEATVMNADGTESSKEAEDFKKLAYIYGLEATDLETTITINGKKVTIKGIKPRSHKYPIIGQEVGTNKRYKYPVNTVLAAMGRKTESSLPTFG